MSPTNNTEKTYVDKLKFWEKLLVTLINTPVSQRCYNLIGTKTVKTVQFVESMKAQTLYNDAALSTMVDYLTKKLLPLSMKLANLYEETASKHYSEDSEENLNRVKYDFIRMKGVNWKDGDFYQGVVLFPIVCTNLLKTVFRLPKAQIEAMDAANDMDDSPKWNTVFTCLLIHLGFGDLSSTSETLAVKSFKSKSMKMEDQNVQDDEEDPTKQAEWDGGIEPSSEGSGGGKRSRTTAQKRQVKRKVAPVTPKGTNLTCTNRREEVNPEREHLERMWRIITQSSSSSSSSSNHPMMLMPTMARFCGSCGHALAPPPPCLL